MACLIDAEGISNTYLFKNIGGESKLVIYLLAPSLEDIFQEIKKNLY